MKNKKNEWRKIPFRNLIDKIEEKQVRINDPHKITRKENKNFFSVHWYDKYDNEIVVLTKSGEKMLKKAMQPFLAEKIKFIDISHDGYGTINTIEIQTKNCIYTYKNNFYDGETLSINRAKQLYKTAKNYNFKSFLKRSGIKDLKLKELTTIIVDRKEFQIFLEKENLKPEDLPETPVFSKEEVSLKDFKIKHINYTEDNKYVIVFQDISHPKDEDGDDSYLYLIINPKGKIIGCPQGEKSLLIKLTEK